MSMDNPYKVAFTEDQIDRLADFLASRSPRFKRRIWVSYIRGECGPNGRKVKVKQ